MLMQRGRGDEERAFVLPPAWAQPLVAVLVLPLSRCHRGRAGEDVFLGVFEHLLPGPWILSPCFTKGAVVRGFLCQAACPFLGPVLSVSDTQRARCPGTSSGPPGRGFVPACAAKGLSTARQREPSC